MNSASVIRHALSCSGNSAVPSTPSIGYPLADSYGFLVMKERRGWVGEVLPMHRVTSRHSFLLQEFSAISSRRGFFLPARMRPVSCTLLMRQVSLECA